ncbi:hypothetical protein EV138_4586 [Kribbella voronezhensis]|uniref:Uncharacterized protein n=1 Tax=Kribbella voronezhensis TaxID=2512212 RepID=A0A4R7TFL2_9ACTN|nr:hypothetical protein EV138_4586 [Kribbella voronezhensis]
MQEPATEHDGSFCMVLTISPALRHAATEDPATRGGRSEPRRSWRPGGREQQRGGLLSTRGTSRAPPGWVGAASTSAKGAAYSAREARAGRPRGRPEQRARARQGVGQPKPARHERASGREECATQERATGWAYSASEARAGDLGWAGAATSGARDGVGYSSPQGTSGRRPGGREPRRRSGVGLVVVRNCPAGPRTGRAVGWCGVKISDRGRGRDRLRRALLLRACRRPGSPW